MALKTLLISVAAWICVALAVLLFISSPADAGWGIGVSCPARPVGLVVAAPRLAPPVLHPPVLHPPAPVLRRRAAAEHEAAPVCGDALPGDALPTGVDADKIDGGDKYSRGGRPSSKRRVFEEMAGGDPSVPDDAAKLSLTCIGTEAECTAVYKDLQQRPDLAALRDKVIFQSYQPDAPMVAKYGFVTSGHPSIYLQSPDGKVIGRLPQYDADKLRKINPDYDPAKDPADHLLKIQPKVTVPVPAWVWPAVIVLGLLIVIGLPCLILIGVVAILMIKRS